MDDEALISIVQENDLLYNTKNPKYRDGQIKKAVWVEIGLQLGASADTCSKRWTVLRDRYCREVRRTEASTESGETFKSKWPHFRNMSFLREYMHAGKQRPNFDLISLVQQNDLLYNKKNPNYKDSKKKKAVWEKIGLQLGVKGDTCSKKWSLLRDTYCRELRRMKASSGSGGTYESKWQQFENMSFIREHMKAVKRGSNFDLIYLVQQNDLLYNKKNPNYKDSQKKNAVWEKIGLQLGASGITCSKRWSGLRDRYCREVRRLEGSSGCGATYESKWQHFEDMSFVREHMLAGRQHPNFTWSSQDSQVFDPTELLDDSFSYASSSPTLRSTSPLSSSVSPVPSTSSRAVKRKRNDAPDPLFEVCSCVNGSLKSEAPQDMVAHNFGKFVESCLTGMEENKKFKLIGDVTSLLIDAKYDS